MTVFHLVRHGDYPLLNRVLAGRLPGHSLSDAGRAQAQSVARALAGEGVEAVVSSPLERALETAEPIAASLGLPITTDTDLNEIDFGAWTGMEFAALHADSEWQAWNRVRSCALVPGGETMLAAQARAMAALSRHGGRRAVAMVSHADVIKAILAHALGAPIDLFGRIEIAPGSRSIVALDDDGPRVQGVNLPAR